MTFPLNISKIKDVFMKDGVHAAYLGVPKLHPWWDFSRYLRDS